MIWSKFVDKYNCVWRNADWPASWHISTKSYHWQWRCGCSLTSCSGHYYQLNVIHSLSWLPLNLSPWGRHLSSSCAFIDLSQSHSQASSPMSCVIYYRHNARRPTLRRPILCGDFNCVVLARQTFDCKPEIDTILTDVLLRYNPT